MVLAGFEIVCPRCRGELREDSDGTRLECCDCGSEYPVLAGIPDLRVFPDPYIGFEDDRAKGLMLAEASKGKSFEQLIDYYYAHTSVVPDEDARLYKRGLLAAEARARAALEGWATQRARPSGGTGERDGPSVGATDPMLDLGCGTGPLLVAAREQFRRRIGVDIAFRWLVVGKKRIEEAGLDVPLVCACAEALPFRAEAFGTVAADSMIEHSQRQAEVAGEVARVLRPGGTWMLSTPNRFSVGPDPHTGLLAGSLIPVRLTASYVRRKGGIPPHRKLLSVGGLRDLLRRQGFTDVRVFAPRISAEQRAHFSGLMGLAIRGYELVQRTPGLRALLLGVGPLLYAVARRVPEARDEHEVDGPERRP